MNEKTKLNSVLPQNLPVWQVELQRKFPTSESILIAYSTKLQLLAHDNEDLFFGEKHPSIKRISITYGRAIAEAWIMEQLSDLMKFTGNKETLTTDEIEVISEAIVCGFPYLKISELMLFFFRFKIGHYGKFYGKPDALTITTSLQEFLKYRALKLNSIESKARSREINSEKQGITASEWIEKKRASGGYVNRDFERIINSQL